MIIALLATLAAPALADGEYSSEPQHLVLADAANVFQESEYDSGWLPSGSPLQVRFQIQGEGATGVAMEGDADLWWPMDLNLGFFPEPGTGELHVDSRLAAVTSVGFDLWGYSWSNVIDDRGFDVNGAAMFDPFVLDDATPNRVEVVNETGGTEVINYSLNVFAGITLIFTANLGPRAIVGFEGVGWQSGEDLVSSSTGTLQYLAEGQAFQDVQAAFIGAWDATLSLVLTPALTVDAGILGSYEVLSFDIPIDLATSAFEQAFPVSSMSFPLPVLKTDLDSYDFGELTVGELANLNLAIHNDGELNLEGTPAVTGSPYFLLYPNYFQASPGQEDGLVVTFQPDTAGAFEATLLLVSNDPATPSKEITLTGVAVDPPVVDAGDTGDTGGGGNATIQSEVHGCGCASGGTSSAASLLLALGLGLAALGRRGRGKE